MILNNAKEKINKFFGTIFHRPSCYLIIASKFTTKLFYPISAWT